MKNKLLSPEWVTDKYILLMLGIFPIWTGFSGYSNITFSKYIFFIIATSIWLTILTMACIITHSKPRICKVSIALLALAITSCISACLSEYRNLVLIGAGRYDGLLTLLFYIAIFIGVSSYAKPKASYEITLAISMTVCCVVSSLQLLGLNPLKLFPNGINYFDHGLKYSSEFLGNIGNVDVFASFLCLSIPWLYSSYIKNAAAKYNWFLILASFGLFIALVSNVASAKVGLLVACIVGLIKLFNHENLKKTVIVIFTVAVVTTIAVNLDIDADGFSFVNDTKTNNESTNVDERSTLYEISQIISGHIEDDYGSGRIGIWRQLLEVFPQSPFIGGGPGTVSKRININYSRYVQETGKTLKTRVDNAHNEYLGYLMDEGLIGLFCYLFAIISTIFNSNKNNNYSQVPILIGMSGYWAQSFFGIGLCLVLPIIWVSWGLMWAKGDAQN